MARAPLRCLGVRADCVTAVEPGLTETETTKGMQSDDMTQIRNNYAKIIPLGRSGTPDDVAQIVAFLASEGSRWVTGSTITASGGRVLF
jgi:3-oxoacyl-[acyl-carrier protein] reductase